MQHIFYIDKEDIHHYLVKCAWYLPVPSLSHAFHLFNQMLVNPFDTRW